MKQQLSIGNIVSNPINFNKDIIYRITPVLQHQKKLLGQASLVCVMLLDIKAASTPMEIEQFFGGLV
jgi:hypothetical protein